MRNLCKMHNCKFNNKKFNKKIKIKIKFNNRNKIMKKIKEGISKLIIIKITLEIKNAIVDRNKSIKIVALLKI